MSYDDSRTSKFQRGDLVKWTPTDEDTATTVPLERNHPGRVGEMTDQWAVSVHWVDREGPLAPEGVYDEDWLSPISGAEFEELSTEIRRKREMREAEGRKVGKTYAPRDPKHDDAGD
jgi:hypothetical protein